MAQCFHAVGRISTTNSESALGQAMKSPHRYGCGNSGLSLRMIDFLGSWCVWLGN